MIRLHRHAATLAIVLLCVATPLFAGPIDDIVSLVSEAQYRDYLDNTLYTHYGHNRDAPGGTHHDLARDAILAAFSGFGLDAVLEPFTWGSYTSHNVVGILEGTNPSAGQYLICAHYDSVGNAGADDNASGVAGVLEAARVLSQYAFESTLVFLAFDAEEDGLRGSYAYAAAHGGDDIKGMVSLDMIAFNHANPVHYNKVLLGVSTANSQSLAVRSALAGAISSYGGIATDFVTMGLSDHVPFANRGSVLVIEHAMTPGSYQNPYYHQATDSVDDGSGNPRQYTYNSTLYDYIDYTYATNLTRGVVGYLAGEAVLVLADVPEPATAVLLLLGMLGVLWRRRKGGR